MSIASVIAMTYSTLLVLRVAVTLVIGLGLVCSKQVYGLGADVLYGRETGPVMGVVSLGAGVFGYVGPQLLGALRDWTGAFNAGWYAHGCTRNRGSALNHRTRQSPG